MTDSIVGVFTTRGADILERRKGGGRLILLGLPFFLVGLFVAQIPFGFIPVEVEGGPLVLAILVPLGPLFAGVGLILMLSRSGITIDRGLRIVVHWWGLLIPIRRRGYDLDSFDKVSIGYREGARNSPDIFPVSLIGIDSHNALHIVDLMSYETAARVADELARFTGKPLEDLAADSQYTEQPLR